MKLDWVFLRLVGLYAIVVTALMYYPISTVVDAIALRSIIAGALLALFHLLFGYVTIELGFDKNSTTFLKIVLGGMVVRLFLMAGIVFLMLKFFQFDPLSLMLSLLFYYIMNLVLEIYLLQRKVSVTHQL